MRERDREPDRYGFLREAEQEEELERGPEPRINEDGMVRDRQADQQRDRLRDADEAVRELPDQSPDEESGR